MGRLALSARALPVILPVRFFVDGGTIVLGLAAHSPFDPVVDRVVAAFAIESVDPITGAGWTVHVQGLLQGRPGGLIARMEPQVVSGWRVDPCPDLDPAARTALR